MNQLTPEAQEKLISARNVWFGSVRPDGRPHLAPVWFVWHAGRVYICTSPSSVKARNIQHDARVVLALEDGDSPVICEGKAVAVPAPWPRNIVALFQSKYAWDASADEPYSMLIEISPDKWLTW